VSADSTDVAIVGWACRFPAEPTAAATTTAVILHAAAGAATPVLPSDPDYFDAGYFGLSREEAAVLDARRCVLLELAHAALENAGYAPSACLPRTAVYLGDAMARVGQGAGGPALRVSSDPRDTLSGWVAERLGLTGESADAAAGSLALFHTLHLARDALLSGEAECALAGTFCARDAAKSEAARGGGVLVLKRLAAARAAGDTVHGVIAGVSVAGGSRAQGMVMGPGAQVLGLLSSVARAAVGAEATGLDSGARKVALEFYGTEGDCAIVQMQTAPIPAARIAAHGPQLLPLSAKTDAALEEVTQGLREALTRQDAAELRDVAFTLQVGREALPSRRVIVCSGPEDALGVISARPAARVISGRVEAKARPRLFLLPGIGDQYVGMAHDLYLKHAAFRDEIDRCAQILEPHLGVDIREILYPANERWKQTANARGIDLKRMLGRAADDPPDPDSVRLNSTQFVQPILFAVEYAMARMWLALGIAPDFLVGHSMGEYVAACVAGVMTLEDALRLIAVRAKLVNEQPQAIMLAVMATEDDLRPILPVEVFISLINGPTHCVVAGPPDEVAALEQVFEAREIIARRVQNGHAFHTMMMEPILRAYEVALRETELRAPQIPYISNVTGTWITAEQAKDPSYWLRHLSQTARFSDALHALWQLPNPVLIECGPGRTLSVLAAQHPDRTATLHGAIWSIRQRYENDTDQHVLLNAVGKVWAAGGPVRWDRLQAADDVRRCPLPAYPYERLDCWSAAIASRQEEPAPVASEARAPGAEDTGDGPRNQRERQFVSIWRSALGRNDVGVNDSFGALGGDSLSSIGALMELKRAGLPDGIARGLFRGQSIRQMVEQEAALGGERAPVAAPGRIDFSSVEMSVFVRAVGIYLVVASHLGITGYVGNPILMVVSGLSFAKFQLLSVAKEGSIVPVLRFMLRLAIPALIDTVARQLAHHSFHPRSWLLIDNLFEPHPFGPYESPYFIDLLLQNFLIASIPLSVAAIRNFAAKRAYLYGMCFFAVSWIASIVVPLIYDPQHEWVLVPHVYMWLLAFGWCAAYATSRKQKALASIMLVCCNAVSQYFGYPFEWYVIIAALSLAWFEELPALLPTAVVRVINAVAAASLFIYLTHYVFYYLIRAIWNQLFLGSFGEFSPLWSIPFIMLGGYGVWRVWNYGTRLLLSWLGKPKLTSEPAGSW